MLEFAFMLGLTQVPPEVSEPETRLPRPEIEVGARVLVRPEARVNENFAPSQGDDSWRVRQAARAWAHGFWGPASVRVALQHTYDWGGPAVNPSGATNRSGLFEGYVDVGGERDQLGGFVRIGRQWFGLGSERLLAYRYWQPGNQSIDAVRVEGRVGRWTVGAFGSLLAAPQTFTITDADDPAIEQRIRTHGHLFGAAYMTVRAHAAATLEGYAFGWNEGPVESAPTRDRRLGTYGLRIVGEPLEGLAYVAEGYVQAGSYDTRDHLAWSINGGLHYEAQRPRLHPGIGVLYEIHSGEGCTNEPDDPAGCGARKSQDFDRLLGIGHRDRGHMDLVGPQNNRTLTLNTWLRPEDELTVALDYHFFQLHQTTGQWSLNSGAPVGRGWDLDNRSPNLGHEIDVNLLYRPWKVLSLRPAYGIFIPDTAGRRIAGSAPHQFVYLWIIAEIGRRW